MTYPTSVALLLNLLSLTGALQNRIIIAATQDSITLDARKVPLMMADAGARTVSSREDLLCEECLLNSDMVEDLAAIGIQIVDPSCGATVTEVQSYLKKAEAVLNIVVKCDPDLEFYVEPLPTEFSGRGQQSECTGGNPRLGTNGPGSSCQQSLEIIRVGPAWQKLKQANKTVEVVLALLDGGVDTKHPDLINQFWKNPKDGSIGYNFASNTTYITDFNGHGTHCAGIAGAQINNSLGVAGAADNIKLMILQIVDGDYPGMIHGTIGDIIRALNFAVEHGAAVSLSSYAFHKKADTLKQAIVNAASKGHVYVTAAGNAGSSVDKVPVYPCVYAPDIPSMLCAAASTSDKDAPIDVASFSNVGSMVHIAAPGVQILSTYSTGRYWRQSGASMAAPISPLLLA
ncbi:Suppressor of the cold-sensitive snRNP bioproteinsis mutant brr1-1 [Perkinsus chesapeaki]|uniref:subtilisin n=1 Tax=Perkinsus chesapeaki TaxID=330153 RepID=A0A7J6N0E1_PERCH|nr:Suppressor of the cold-sensitive snRNP bioproteinsis mutant brr1-1 [Perkinsus chesapeaki]